MEIIESMQPLFCDTVVALGYFDGVHIGHRAVIDAALALAHKREACAAVLTLDMSSLRASGKGQRDLITKQEKRALIERLGVDKYVELDFGEVASMSAEQFVGRVLGSECMSALGVCCGEDFRFGSGRSGSVDTLRELCYGMEIDVSTVGEICYGEQPVSTTRIKGCVVNGEIADAVGMLGHSYGFSLPVVAGRHLAGRLGFPTVNQRFPEGITLPRFGVYRSRVSVEGREYDGVTNVGVRPTVDSTGTVMIETHILDFRADLYGKTVRTDLTDFLRDEKRFSSDTSLRSQVIRDIQRVRELTEAENAD